MKKYARLPEEYFCVPQDEEINIDALMCALSRASAVCKLLSTSFGDTPSKFNDVELGNVCWALEGLIAQAKMLVCNARVDV